MKRSLLILYDLLFFSLGGVFVLLAALFTLNQQESTTEQVILDEVGKNITEIRQEFPPDYIKGKQLFRTNCAQCHARDMVTNLTGPALANVEANWVNYPQEDLYRWIRNSQAMIDEQHPRAVEVWEEWSPTVMNNFPNLEDEDITAILSYIRETSPE